MAEWLHEAQYSLVVFTVLIQVTVGALWVLAAADLQLGAGAGRRPGAVHPAGQRPPGARGGGRPAVLHHPPGPAAAGHPGPASLGELVDVAGDLGDRSLLRAHRPVHGALVVAA